MIIDIHIHEKTYSLDSQIGLEEIVEEARRKGLDGVCITDHDSNQIAEVAHAYREKCGFIILVGAEILTFEGDILVFGIDTYDNKKMHADELLDFVTKQGGVGIAAHPYRENNRGLGDNITKISNLNGIEVFNGRTEPHNNVKALKASQQFHIAGLGGSDAHRIDEVGGYATDFSYKIKNEKDFILAVKAKKFEPVVYDNGTYQRIKRRISNEKNMYDYSSNGVDI